MLHEFSYIRLDGRIGCYLAVVRHCPKSSEKGEFLEQRNSMTQIMTQNSKSPLGQLGHVSKEFIKFSNKMRPMDVKTLGFLLYMISGPRGLGFESRHSDQKMGIRTCGFPFLIDMRDSKSLNRHMPLAYGCHQFENWWLQ